MWGLLEFLLLDFSVQARRSTACLSIPSCFPLQDERGLGAVRDESWIEGYVTTISQKDCKKKKIEQLGKYGRGSMQITKTPTLNKTCAMKKRWWKCTYLWRWLFEDLHLPPERNVSCWFLIHSWRCFLRFKSTNLFYWKKSHWIFHNLISTYARS